MKGAIIYKIKRLLLLSMGPYTVGWIKFGKPASETARINAKASLNANFLYLSTSSEKKTIKEEYYLLPFILRIS